MELSGKRVVVVGLGKSGIAAAKLCLARGAKVTGTDSASADKLSPEAKALGIELILGGHADAKLETANLIVVSPGVPDLPELTRAELAGVEVIGELELASRFVEAPIVAIGGTNGKSTTTTLVGDMFKAGGLKTFVGGNLGTPSAEAVDPSYDVVVFEVSSFQLERVPSFRPRVSVLLNITEDHLDRYPSFLAYAEAKGNAFASQTPDDFAIVPDADSDCLQQARRGRAKLLSFGSYGDYVVSGRTVTETRTGELFDLESSALHGRHNIENAAAAIAAARSLDLDLSAIRRALLAFRPLPHRMARVASVASVNFYDDSKGTNVGASVTALRGLAEARGVLIAGGRDKQGDYEPLVSALEEKGRAVVVLGEAAERIASAVGSRVPLERASTMDDAVNKAFSRAKPGDAVLLSPACSSFDMFQSYADRGDQFVSAVQRLAESQPEVTA
ncbi:MAG TPA: UDP-N-acetylmuramoyl-L-alanine--D-glutamate ligase [Polyangiaceae bacterium]|jgi:UDP-N-acetylmuramoylalanine--D-glutamate ligase|nr:UDP-N-acetylmuramoyl-L-alanine--D-glutamate ligase [Polyangiaceae bacterium]